MSPDLDSCISYQDLAMEAGWAVISEASTPGFLARIKESIQHLEQELGQGSPTRRTTALLPAEEVSWRRQGTQLLSRLAGHHNGLLITVDEIHAADRTGISQFAANVQHSFAEQTGLTCMRRRSRTLKNPPS